MLNLNDFEIFYKNIPEDHTICFPPYYLSDNSKYCEFMCKECKLIFVFDFENFDHAISSGDYIACYDNDTYISIRSCSEQCIKEIIE